MEYFRQVPTLFKYILWRPQAVETPKLQARFHSFAAAASGSVSGTAFAGTSSRLGAEIGAL